MAVARSASPPAEVPRSFRRESRLFLWIALLLILFLNLLTLRFFRSAVDWGTQEAERRAGEILRRIALSSGRGEAGDETMERAALEPDVAYVALYDGNGRRLRSLGPGPAEAPVLLEERPAPGRIQHVWSSKPQLVISTFATEKRFFVLALDPGAGGVLRDSARRLSIFIPAAGVALVILAALYLRSLLKPYDRLLAAAGDAPVPVRESGD